MAFMVHATIFADMLDEIDAYSEAERGRILTAMLEYMVTGKKPTCTGNERFILPSIIGRLSREAAEQSRRAERSRANGANGGRPRNNPENPVGFSETHNNPENPVALNYNSNLEPITNNLEHRTDNSNNKDTARSAPTRHRYGQYQNVLLTDEDMGKLKAEFPGDWQERVERLSEYMASKGVSYKNHLATIRAWARKNGDKKPKASEYTDDFEEIFGRGAM